MGRVSSSRSRSRARRRCLVYSRPSPAGEGHGLPLAKARASSISSAHRAGSRSPIRTHSRKVRPAGANGLPALAWMSCSTRCLGSLTIRSPERWSQEAKNAPETRRQGKPIIVPVATSLLVSAAALTSQKKSVGCSVIPGFFHDSFLGGVRLNLQQVAGGGQPARPRRRGAFDDHLAAGAAVVPAGLAGGPAVKEHRAGAHDKLGAGRGTGFL